MPVISRFHGIAILMNKEAGAKHKKPHIHAYYQDDEAPFDIETGEILANADFPGKQTRLVRAWLEMHRDELQKEWNALNDGKDWFEIKGLN